MKQNYIFTNWVLPSMVMVWLFTSLTLSAQTGIFTVNGDLTLSVVTNTQVQLVDLSGAGTGHDQIATTGDATIDGTLQIILDGYTPSPNDQFEIMDITGTQLSQVPTAGLFVFIINQGIINV